LRLLVRFIAGFKKRVATRKQLLSEIHSKRREKQAERVKLYKEAVGETEEGDEEIPSEEEEEEEDFEDESESEPDDEPVEVFSNIQLIFQMDHQPSTPEKPENKPTTNTVNITPETDRIVFVKMILIRRIAVTKRPTYRRVCSAIATPVPMARVQRSYRR